MKRHSDGGEESHSKRNKGKSKGGGKSRSKGDGGGISIVGLGQPRKYAFKVLCSDPLAANLIGKEGKTRAQIEEDTGSSVWISKRDETFPKPAFRLLILHADEPHQVLNALDQVVPRLVEVATRDRENGDLESPLVGKEPGEYVFHCTVPALIRGKLIGTKGANIQELREQTGAKIFVDNDAFSGHHATRIIGVPEKITDVLRRLNEFVQEVAGTEEFDQWIVCQPEAAGSSQSRDRRRSPPRERERDRHRGAPRERDQPKDNPPRRRGDSRPRQASRGRHGAREDRGHGGDSADESYFPHVPDLPNPPLDSLDKLASAFPEGAVQYDHSINCELPECDFTEDLHRFIEEKTGAKLNVSTLNDPDSEDSPFVNIQFIGPLFSTYLAHAIVMQQVHSRRAEQEAAANEAPAPDVADLKAQVEALQAQLKRVEANTNHGGGGRSIGGRR
jgi:hypothetical protein